MDIINYVAEQFNMKKDKIVMASDLELKTGMGKSDPSQDLVAICNALGGTTYLSGDGGKNYLDKELFEKEGLAIQFQDYDHPVYEQNFPGFLKHMSAIDALFCLGEYPQNKTVKEGEKYEFENK